MEMKKKNEDIFLIGVTGCPTGVAHTYIAAETLKKAAEKRNISIKVETNGSIGVEDSPTEEEIKRADAVIVACDKQVDLDRFAGKRVLFVPTGALLSTVSYNEGKSVPGIAHGVILEGKES